MKKLSAENRYCIKVYDPTGIFTGYYQAEHMGLLHTTMSYQEAFTVKEDGLPWMNLLRKHLGKEFDESAYTIDEVTPQKATFEDFVYFITREKRIGWDTLLIRDRRRNLVYIRQIIMFIAHKRTELTLKAIGQKFATHRDKGFDHTTVLHSINTIHDLIDTDDAVRAEIEYFLKVDVLRALSNDLKAAA